MTKLPGWAACSHISFTTCNHITLTTCNHQGLIGPWAFWYCPEYILSNSRDHTLQCCILMNVTVCVVCCMLVEAKFWPSSSSVHRAALVHTEANCIHRCITQVSNGAAFCAGRMHGQHRHGITGRTTQHIALHCASILQCIATGIAAVYVSSTTLLLSMKTTGGHSKAAAPKGSLVEPWASLNHP